MQSPSLASPNQPLQKCESFKHETFAIQLLQHQSMQFFNVVTFSFIVAIAFVFVVIHEVMLSQSSFERYNER